MRNNRIMKYFLIILALFFLAITLASLIINLQNYNEATFSEVFLFTLSKVGAVFCFYLIFILAAYAVCYCLKIIGQINKTDYRWIAILIGTKLVITHITLLASYLIDYTITT